MGEIIFTDEIPCGDEIRLDAGWVDLISSERSEDFICTSRFHPCVSKDFIALCRSFSIAGLREFKSIGENPEKLNIQGCAESLLLFRNAVCLAILTFIFYSGKMKLENILTTVLRHGRKCENKT